MLRKRWDCGSNRTGRPGVSVLSRGSRNFTTLLLLLRDEIGHNVHHKRTFILCTHTYTEKHGVSFWAKTGRIDVLLRDGAPQSFFINVISKELGMNMTRSEFHSVSAMHKVLPEFVPRTIACGTYKSIPASRDLGEQ